MSPLQPTAAGWEQAAEDFDSSVRGTFPESDGPTTAHSQEAS